jgi:hypothetical protein
LPDATPICALSPAFICKTPSLPSQQSSEVSVKLNLEKTFKHYFPSSFEMFIIGGVFFVMSLPGIGMIFVHHDAVFRSWLGLWGDIVIAGACVIGLLGIVLIFCGFRRSALPGSFIYRLTHLR